MRSEIRRPNNHESQNMEESLSKNEEIYSKNIHHFHKLAQLIIEELSKDPEKKINFNWIKQNYTLILKPISTIRTEDGSIDWKFIIDKLKNNIAELNSDINIIDSFTYSEKRDRDTKNIIKEVIDVFQELNAYEYEKINLPSFLKKTNSALYEAITNHFRDPKTNLVDWQRIIFGIESHFHEWEDKLTFKKLKTPRRGQGQKKYNNIHDFIRDAEIILDKEEPETFNQTFLYVRLSNISHLLSKEGKSLDELISLLPEKWRNRFQPSRRINEAKQYRNVREVDQTYEENHFADKKYLLLLDQKTLSNQKGGEQLFESRNNVIDDLAKLARKGNLDALDELQEYLPTILKDTLINYPEFKESLHVLTDEFLQKIIKSSSVNWEQKAPFIQYVINRISFEIIKQRKVFSIN